MHKLFNKREFVIIILLFSLLRLLAITFMGLMPQDAYYTYYSQSLALSYFDHPPMVAYMIKLFLLVLPKSAIGLHLADFIITSLTLFLTYLLAKRLLPKESADYSLILLIISPLVTILSINTTPDVPLMFFWALALLWALNAVEKGEWYWWLLSGAASGFAFDSKYSALFLPAGLLLFLLISKEHRPKLFSYKALLFILAFAVAISPVLIWNFGNDFISLKYQSSERVESISSFKFNPTLFLGYFFSQMLLVLPLFFIDIWRSGWGFTKRLFKGEQISTTLLFTASLTLPMLLFFTSISFIYWVKINWIMPIFITASIMVASVAVNKRVFRAHIIFSTIAHLLLLVQLIWMPVKIKSDDNWLGWKSVASKLEQIQNQNPNRFVFSDNSYKVSAVLNFYSQEHIYAGNIIGKFAYQFALDDNNLSHLHGKDAIYVTSERYRRKNLKVTTIEQMLGEYFSSSALIDSVEIKNRCGSVHRKFYFYECKEYN